MQVLGIDIGGSGIKAAPVNVRSGRLLAERCRVETPNPATVSEITDAVESVVEHFTWEGVVGCAFPGLILEGRVRWASNIGEWKDRSPSEVFAQRLGRPVAVINDASAAGIAEMKFGAGKGKRGVVILVTLGTGIGSAIFLDGKLLPNSALGQLEIEGRMAAMWASNRLREETDLSWKKWAARLETFFKKIERMLSPELFIVGGGVSRHHEEFLPLIEIETPVVPAAFRNDAGIIGAALNAATGVSAKT